MMRAGRGVVAIVPASPAHVGRIAAAMRAIDRREAAAMGHAPKAALRAGLVASSDCWTALVDGVPAAMFGVVPVSAIDRSGRPWFLGTDAVPRQARALIALGPDIVARMHAEFAHLANHVSCENRRAIGLLRRWGFVVEEEEMVMFGDMGFYAFRSVR